MAASATRANTPKQGWNYLRRMVGIFLLSFTPLTTQSAIQYRYVTSQILRQMRFAMGIKNGHQNVLSAYVDFLNYLNQLAITFGLSVNMSVAPHGGAVRVQFMDYACVASKGE